MRYQERLICFVDLLGFGSAITQSVGEPEIAERMFSLFSDFMDGGLERAIYSTIPHLTDDGLSTCGEIYGDEVLNRVDPHYDMVLTQFSDSFVISVPAENAQACVFLMRALRTIHVYFFEGLGMLMRGGIAVGQLVHQRGGALFGPAMVEAYGLESKSAIYARVVLSEKAADIVRAALSQGSIEGLIFKAFDGFYAFDLVSAVVSNGYHQIDSVDFEEHLVAVESDILKRTPAAHPKVAYLKSRWESEQAKSAGVNIERLE